MNKLTNNIYHLVNYAVAHDFIKDIDRTWAMNKILEQFGIDSLDDDGAMTLENLEIGQILDNLSDIAVEEGIIEDNVTDRDLFDTKLIGALTPKPSEVNEIFWEKYENSPQEATDWYYDFSQDTNYIRKDRIAKDEKWKAATNYGALDITINLSKPEKDPRLIALAGKTQSTSYPKCQLCSENEGYAGRIDHPARQNHRIIPIEIQGSPWNLQYSPYVYYPEHCIVFNNDHVPMVIDRSAFNKLLDFIDIFPHYFVGSNADLPIVGGSILSHEHFQGGHYRFAMEDAEIKIPVTFKGYEDVEAGIVNWPMSVIRLRGKNRDDIVDLSETILNDWRKYSDESVGILAETEGTPHNTITPIARKKGDLYEMDLVLRNNRTDEDHPLGIFHPHEQYHHIKKENIGLIEVMGLAVLPARLKEELELVQGVLAGEINPDEHENLDIHRDWIDYMKRTYGPLTPQEARSIINYEVGQIFSHVLEDAGVYKQTPEGQKAFLDFVESVNNDL